MTYDYMSDWLSPIYRRTDAPPTKAIKNDMPFDVDEPIESQGVLGRLHYIPFGSSVLKKPLQNVQVFVDEADHEEFGHDQVRIIRGYFDHQFRGIAFIYKSGRRRVLGPCVGASADFELEAGERIYSLRYKPGPRFALCVSDISGIIA
jgi:hypothetical protein